MFEVKTTPEFDLWLQSVRDKSSQTRLVARLRKVSIGLLGDVKAVGAGVMEMREHFGPGWRMYYLQQGNVLIIMLGGGDKSTQSSDISKAKELANKLEF